MEKFHEQTIKEMYSKRRSLNSISKKTGFSTQTIKKYLVDNKLWTGHRPLITYCDEFYFDVIDTEEKAYWLGFIYADGYISKTNVVGIELKSTEYPHIEKFKKSIQSEHQIHIYHKNSTFGPQDNARIAISSKHMSNILENYYTTRNKSYSGKLPEINSLFIPAMIRGVFDGDGSITGEPKDIEHLWKPNISLTGTKEAMAFIEEKSNFLWTWSQRHPERDTNNYSICCGRVNDCLSFLHYIYDGATVYLERKYQSYLNLLENRQRLQAKARV